MFSPFIRREQEGEPPRIVLFKVPSVRAKDLPATFTETTMGAPRNVYLER